MPGQMEQIAEKLVDVQKLQGSAFQAIGRCKKCGWQAMGQEEDEVKKKVKTHALVHGPELQAEIQAAQQGGGGGGGQQQQGGQPGQQQQKTGQQQSQQSNPQQRTGTAAPQFGR